MSRRFLYKQNPESVNEIPQLNLTHELNGFEFSLSRAVKETSKRISEFTQRNAAIYYLPSEIYLIPVESMLKKIKTIGLYEIIG